MIARVLFGVAVAAFAAAITFASGASDVNDTAISSGLPRDLQEYGFFAADPSRQQPADGVIPYRLNTPLYSDGAAKLRFVYVPDGAEVGVSAEGLLEFPVGSALIKTFAFEEGGKLRLIETRVLLHRSDGWLALPYLWNEAQTEAKLAVAGARVEVTTPQGEAISYRVPNKNQCKECHGLNGDVVPIGPKVRNLSADWLGAMLGTVPAGADKLPVWEDRASASTQAMARAYLDVNCAHCHRPGAMASNSGLDLRWEQDDARALGIFKRPVAAGRGAGDNLYDVVPGHPEKSILLQRMFSAEPGIAMPELGKATVDREGAEAVRRWIVEMPEP